MQSRVDDQHWRRLVAEYFGAAARVRALASGNLIEWVHREPIG